MSNRTITFLSDKMNIRTRSSDNTMIISFETGEYQINEIAELLKLLSDKVYKVTVEVE